jgi:hypothetical protein
MTTIKLEHPLTKRVKVCPIGFSWLAFFFGALVPFFRGLPKLGFIVLVFGIVYIGIFFFLFLFPLLFNFVIPNVITSFFVISIVIGFIYGKLMNKYCIEAFLRQGYVPMDDESSNLIKYL